MFDKRKSLIIWCIVLTLFYIIEINIQVDLFQMKNKSK